MVLDVGGITMIWGNTFPPFYASPDDRCADKVADAIWNVQSMLIIELGEGVAVKSP